MPSGSVKVAPVRQSQKGRHGERGFHREQLDNEPAALGLDRHPRRGTALSGREEGRLAPHEQIGITKRPREQRRVVHARVGSGKEAR